MRNVWAQIEISFNCSLSQRELFLFLSSCVSPCISEKSSTMPRSAMKSQRSQHELSCSSYPLYSSVLLLYLCVFITMSLFEWNTTEPSTESHHLLIRATAGIYLTVKLPSQHYSIKGRQQTEGWSCDGGTRSESVMNRNAECGKLRLENRISSRALIQQHSRALKSSPQDLKETPCLCVLNRIFYRNSCQHKETLSGSPRHFRALILRLTLSSHLKDTLVLTFNINTHNKHTNTHSRVQPHQHKYTMKYSRIGTN